MGRIPTGDRVSIQIRSVSRSGMELRVVLLCLPVLAGPLSKMVRYPIEYREPFVSTSLDATTDN